MAGSLVRVGCVYLEVTSVPPPLISLHPSTQLFLISIRMDPSTSSAASSRKRKRPQLPTPEHSYSFPDEDDYEHYDEYDERYSDEYEYDDDDPSAAGPSTNTTRYSTGHGRREGSGTTMPPRSDSPAQGVLKPAPLDLPNSGLNRGFACLGCRKRKSK